MKDKLICLFCGHEIEGMYHDIYRHVMKTYASKVCGCRCKFPYPGFTIHIEYPKIENYQKSEQECGVHYFTASSSLHEPYNDNFDGKLRCVGCGKLCQK